MGSNHRHHALQARALPTELPRHKLCGVSSASVWSDHTLPFGLNAPRFYCVIYYTYATHLGKVLLGFCLSSLSPWTIQLSLLCVLCNNAYRSRPVITAQGTYSLNSITHIAVVIFKFFYCFNCNT